MQKSPMRQDAIDTAFRKYEDAAMVFYRQGYDKGELVESLRELVALGADMNEVAYRRGRVLDKILAEKKGGDG